MIEFDRDRKTQVQDSNRSAGFIAKSVLPGESQEDFDLLLDELWGQYAPQGSIEEDAVQTIAQAIWRKNHLGVFNQAFVARKKWGSYFAFSGDPDGPARMLQRNHEKLAVLHLEFLTTCTTHFVDKRLADATAAKAPGHQAIRITEDNAAETAANGDVRSDPAAQANDATADLIPDVIREAVETAVSKIDEISRGGARNRAVSAESKARIIRNAVEQKIEVEMKNPKPDKPMTGPEEIEMTIGLMAKLAATMETAFGVAFTEEFFETMLRQFIEHELASFGDLLTPYGYISELEFAERLDLTIERAHNRLMKYQAQRIKKSATNIASLQPDWVARRR